MHNAMYVSLTRVLNFANTADCTCSTDASIIVLFLTIDYNARGHPSENSLHSCSCSCNWWTLTSFIYLF